MRAHLASLLTLALSALAVPAHAAPAEPSPEARAQAIYAEGVDAFKAGEFETALARFEAAHALDPAPVLLYNMARANEELGRPAAAASRYSAYIDAAPAAPDRPDVEQRIRILQAIVGNIDRDDCVALMATGDPPPSLRPFAYGALGAGAVMIVLAIVGSADLETARADFDKADDVTEKVAAEEAGRSAALLANTGWITGGLLLGAGGALWLLEPDTPAISAGTVPGGLAPSGLMFQWSTRW